MAFFSLAKLVDKRLLKIKGPDCFSYLQGLLSNDLRYLYESTRIPERKHAIKSRNVMGTFMLNSHGKVMCDMLLYRTQLTRPECEFTAPGKATEHDELLIECDSTLASGIANTLYGYRVRRKVSLLMEENLHLWCLYPTLQDDNSEISEQNGNSLISLNNNEVIGSNLTVVNDPRLAMMGMRIISSDAEPEKVKRSLESLVNYHIEHANLKDYIMHRYKIGLAEGVRDIPEGFCFPLEYNGEQMNYVSFSKGCYLGQELTSRIHHTGVVRKRLMPIVIDISSKVTPKENLPLLDGSEIVYAEDTKQKIGILRSSVNNRGLALLKYELALSDKLMIHAATKTKLTAYAPYWWNNK